jgi:hypothetical protein
MEATHKVDEVDRIAVRLPDDATFYGTPMFVAIAVDLGCEGIEPVLLGQHHRLRFLAQYEVMSLLCDDRAQLAVDGQLRCRGARVTPEHYLALWRKALLAPLSAQELYEQHGWSLIARLKGPLSDPRWRDRTSGWTCCPFKTFAAFRERYGDRLEHQCEGRFSLDIDLAEPDGARNAFYGESLLSAVLGHQGPWSAKLSLVREALTPDLCMFSGRTELQEA